MNHRSICIKLSSQGHGIPRPLHVKKDGVQTFAKDSLLFLVINPSHNGWVFLVFRGILGNKTHPLCKLSHSLAARQKIIVTAKLVYICNSCLLCSDKSLKLMMYDLDQMKDDR